MWPVIELGGVHVRTYPLIVTSGVLLCWALLLRRTRRLGYSSRGVLLWVGLAFPVGALGGHALATLVDGLSVAAAANGARGGMTVMGSIVACIAFSWAYVPRVFGEPAWRLLDAVAFTLPLSIGIGRLGCLANGCCFGTPGASGPWGVAVSAYDGSTAAAAAYGHTGAALWNLPLLFALQCTIALVLVEAVYASRGRWRLPDGTVIAWAVFLDACGRLAIEPLRGGVIELWAGLSPWQITAGVIASVAAAVVSMCMYSARVAGRMTRVH